MAVYLYQSRETFMIKFGYAKEGGVSSRGKAHSTSGGPQRLLGVLPGGTTEHESLILCLKQLEPWRVHESGRRFELFRPSPEVILFVNKGHVLKDMGFCLEQRAKDPRKETAKQWLERVRDYSDPRGVVHKAAHWALREEARLRETVPKSARGGWDLAEHLGGNGSLNRQMLLNFSSNDFLGEHWLVHRVTYNGSSGLGAVFEFPVFVEFFEREHPGKRSPKEAISAGVAYHKKKFESGRKGKSVKRLSPSNPNQMTLVA
jgi:hypothetical protein